MTNPKPFTPAELAAFQGRKGTDGWARMTCEELDRLLAMAGRAVSERISERSGAKKKTTKPAKGKRRGR